MFKNEFGPHSNPLLLIPCWSAAGMPIHQPITLIGPIEDYISSSHWLAQMKRLRQFIALIGSKQSNHRKQYVGTESAHGCTVQYCTVQYVLAMLLEDIPVLYSTYTYVGMEQTCRALLRSSVLRYVFGHALQEMPSLNEETNTKSLLVLILDVTPKAWGERELRRKVSDQKRLASKKSSVGPAKLSSDVLPAVITFLLAFASLHRENCAVVIAIAGDETAVVYPRKGGPNPNACMVHMVNDPPETSGSKIDARTLHDMILLGVAELVVRATAKAEKVAAAATVEAARATQDDQATAAPGGTSNLPQSSCGATIAAALSLALCCINRFVTSALGGPVSSAEVLLKRREDEGVLSMIEGRSKKSFTGGVGGESASSEHSIRAARGVPSSRILILQATEDRTKDYNALMNCTFAAIKCEVVIDVCFFPIGTGKKETSTFLEQACDRTGGVFLAPTGAAQVEGALTEVLVSVFLPSVPARAQLNLPALTEVDFRARCFESGDSVDIAFVCNQCLSIFKRKPTDSCPTCGAVVVVPTKRKADITGGKRTRLGS